MANSARSDRTPAAPQRPLAVAIGRVEEANQAPRVLAKGHGAVAEQILNIAFDRGVKVRTDPDLAQMLAAVEVDSEVPVQALATVAEILSYVYRATRPAGPEGPA